MRTFDDSKQKHRIDVLDGVRAVACLGVISFHLNLWSYAGHIWSPRLDNIGAIVSSLAFIGEMCIILFFILSGFLLFLPFARAMLFERTWPSVSHFYIRRAFRILPAYYLALALMILYLAPEYLQHDHWPQVWLFLSLQMDVPLTYQQINAPFWTLAIEFQFYIFLPLIAWLMGRIVRGGTIHQRHLKLTLCIVGLFLWGMLTRYWGVMIAPTSKMDFLLPHNISDALLPYLYGTRGKFYDAFAIGMFISTSYAYLQGSPLHEHVRQIPQQLSPWLFVLGLTIINIVNVWHFYAIYVANLALHFLDPFQDFLLGGNKDIFMPLLFELGYGLCLFAIIHGKSYLRRPFEWLPLRQVGFISYSLYLWHDPFALFFLSSLLPKFQQLDWSTAEQYGVYVLWVVVSVFPLAVALYTWVELPSIRFGEKVYRQFNILKKRGMLLSRNFEKYKKKIIARDKITGTADKNS